MILSTLIACARNRHPRYFVDELWSKARILHGGNTDAGSVVGTGEEEKGYVSSSIVRGRGAAGGDDDGFVH